MASYGEKRFFRVFLRTNSLLLKIEENESCSPCNFVPSEPVCNFFFELTISGNFKNLQISLSEIKLQGLQL